MSDDVLDAMTAALDESDIFDESYGPPILVAAKAAAVVLEALSAAGLVVLRDPSGTLQHGDELVRTGRKVCVYHGPDGWCHNPLDCMLRDTFTLRRSVPDLESAAPNPSPATVPCPECGGWGGEHGRSKLNPAYTPCPRCGGAGRLQLQGNGNLTADAEASAASVPATPERNQPCPE